MRKSSPIPIRSSSLAVALLVMCSCASIEETPAQTRGHRVQAYLVVDFHSKKILSAHNADSKRQVASLTKIAMAMVALDWARATGSDLGQLAMVPPSAMAVGGPNPMGLRAGDRLTLRDALYCAIIGSDNLAAETIATHVGRDLVARSGRGGAPVAAFVKEMNSLAKVKGGTRTKFTNPHGMDHRDPVPYSTAADIGRLAIYAMSQPGFTFFCSQKKREVTVQTVAGPRAFVVKNTNKLLGVDDVDGVKTGMTSRAGPCLVISADKPSLLTELADGRKRVTLRRLVVVVLGADDRFGSSRSLLMRGWEKFGAWNAGGRKIVDAAELLSMPKE